MFEELLTRVVGPCRDVLDAVLLTGDMSTDGNRSDMIYAAQQIKRLVEKLAVPNQSVEAALDRVFLVPGNHDRYLGHWKRAGGTEFDRWFGRYWPPDKRRATTACPRYGACEASSETLFVISADLSLARTRHATGKWRGGHLGQGKVYPETIQELEAASQPQARKYQPTVDPRGRRAAAACRSSCGRPSFGRSIFLRAERQGLFTRLSG